MWVAKSPKWQPLPSLFLHYEESQVDFLWWGLEQQIPKIPFPHIIQYLWKAFEEEGSYWTNWAKATTRSGENRNTGGSFPSSSISREFLNSLSSNHLPVTISLLILIAAWSTQPSSKPRRAEHSYLRAAQPAWKIAIRQQRSLSDDSLIHSLGVIKAASSVPKDAPKINSPNPHHDTWLWQ